DAASLLALRSCLRAHSGSSSEPLGEPFESLVDSLPAGASSAPPWASWMLAVSSETFDSWSLPASVSAIRKPLLGVVKSWVRRGHSLPPRLTRCLAIHRRHAFTLSLP